MNPDQKKTYNDWYMKIDPPLWITVDFKRMNRLVESNKDKLMDKLLVNKPFARGYIIVKNPVYDNLSLQKDGYKE